MILAKWRLAAFFLVGAVAGGEGVCFGQAVAEAPALAETVKPSERDEWWKSMHDSFLTQTKAGKIDLLFLGDSITQGWAAEGSKEVWERYYGSRKAANYGIGGDRTQHVLWRLEHGEVDGIKPKVVVLMIGTNNVGSDSAADIAAGVKAIVDRLRKALPDTKVLLLGVFPRGEKPDDTREKLKEVNARIARLDDGKMVDYLDIGRHFLNEDGSISAEVMPDFLHLSKKGYQIWADAIEPTVWRMMEGK